MAVAVERYLAVGATPDLIERVPLLLVRQRRLDVQRRGHHRRRLRGRPLGRRPGHGPRRQRARAPRDRAAPVGGALPLPRPERPRHRLVDRRHRAADLPVRADRAPDRLPAGRAARQAFRGDRPQLVARRRRDRLDAGARLAVPGAARPASTSSTATARRSRPSSSPSPRSTSTASSAAPTARSATCASVTGSRASCAAPRSATDSSSTTRRTSSSPSTPTAASRSCPSRSGGRSAGTRPTSLGTPYTSLVRQAGGPGPGQPLRPDARATRTSSSSTRWSSSTPMGSLVPFEVSAVGVRMDGEFGRRPRLGPRHRRARATRARPARVGGALPLPGPVLAGHRVRDRCRGYGSRSSPIAIERDAPATRPDDARASTSRCSSTSLARSVAGDAGRPSRTAPGARSSRPTRPARHRTAAVPGRRPGDRRDRRRGRVRRDPGRDARHQRRRCACEGELRRQAGELAAGEERAHLARELHDSVTQALFSMTLVARSVEMLLDRDPDGRSRPARPAARPPARGAGRDARAHLRAAPGQPRAGRPGPRAQDPQRARCRAASACRSSSRATSTSGSRWPSRRRSTGSPRRRSTTSSSTPRRTRSARGPRARAAASGCASRTTARASTRPRPRRPPRAGRDARPGGPGRRASSVHEPGRRRHDIEVVMAAEAIAEPPGSRQPRHARACRPKSRRSATDDVGGLRRSAEAGRVDGPFRADRGAAPRWGHAQPGPVTDGPLRVLVVDADDRVRESLAGLLAIGGQACRRRERRAVGPGPRPRARPPIPTSSSSIPACPRSTAGSRSSRGLRALVPAMRILAMSWSDTLECGRARERRRRVRPQDLPPDRADRRDRRALRRSR